LEQRLAMIDRNTRAAGTYYRQRKNSNNSQIIRVL
jgi:hypothetical protein